MAFRRLLASVQAGHAGTDYITGTQSGISYAAVLFFVSVFVLPAALAICLRPWRWLSTGKLPKSKEPPKPEVSGLSMNGQHQASVRAAPAPVSQDSASLQGAADTCNSNLTPDGLTRSAKSGQPANPISLPNQKTGEAVRQQETPKAAPGPSYESDDEDDRRATAEGRLNDITRSVKSHANAAGAASLDEAERRQAEEAAKRLAADTKAVAAAPVLAMDESTDAAAAAAAAAGPSGAAASETPVVAPAAPPAPPLVAAAPAAQAEADEGGAESKGVQPAEAYDIDLDIDLAKGDLKVDYSARGLLGQGGFAAVYKGRYKGERVAVKMIKKTAGSSLADLQEDMNALVHELHILRQVNHPNIVTLFGGCLKPPHVFLVEERMEGTLDFYVHQVRKHDALSVREVVYFALDVACGLSYLHPSIVHRDLKPANVLLTREGRCKISDFGLARTKMKEYLSTKNLDAGTTAYIAPECFMTMDNPDMHDLRRSVTDRTDIYALGIIMWEMLARKRPWQGLKPLLVAYQVAYRSLRPPLFELGPRCPAKLRQLLEECWCQEPKQRPSSQQVVDRLLEILSELPPEQDFPAYAQQPQPVLPQLPAAAVAPGQGQQHEQPTSTQAMSHNDLMVHL